MQNNLPPGCNASDIPGNQKEDADWENACEIASAVCVSSVPRIFGTKDCLNRILRASLLTEKEAKELVEAIATSLLTAYNNGVEYGNALGRGEA